MKPFKMHNFCVIYCKWYCKYVFAIQILICLLYWSINLITKMLRAKWLYAVLNLYIVVIRRNNNWLVPRKSSYERPRGREVSNTAVKADQVWQQVTCGVCQVLSWWSVPSDRKCWWLHWGLELHNWQSPQRSQVSGSGMLCQIPN